jgi:hypothetical protein
MYRLRLRPVNHAVKPQVDRPDTIVAHLVSLSDNADPAGVDDGDAGCESKHSAAPVSHTPAFTIERATLTLLPRDERNAAIERAAISVREMDALIFTPTREQPCAEMRARGVYISDVTHNGLPIVYSVDSKHDVLQWSPWYAGHLLETIQRDLWSYLNTVDPVVDEL